MPRPSSPTSWPRTPWNSTSLDGSERVPSLSFSRWIRKPGSRPSIRKQDRPAGACASVRKRSQGGYEQNHLWPVISQRVAVLDGARGVRAHVRAALLLGHRHPHERAVVVARPRDARLPLGGQVGLLAQRRDRRVGHRDRAHHARIHLAPDEEQRRAHGVRRRAAGPSTAASGSRARSPAAGTSARTGRAPPRRSGCRSGRACGGSARCARPARSARSPRASPASSPVSRRRSMPQPPPSRSTASRSGRSDSKTL